MPLEDRETNARMAIQSLDYFQQRWPHAKVWYMHMSMMNEDDVVIKKARESSQAKEKAYLEGAVFRLA